MIQIIILIIFFYLIKNVKFTFIIGSAKKIGTEHNIKINHHKNSEIKISKKVGKCRHLALLVLQ